MNADAFFAAEESSRLTRLASGPYDMRDTWGAKVPQISQQEAMLASTAGQHYRMNHHPRVRCPVPGCKRMKDKRARTCKEHRGWRLE